jgi:mRNA interferase MazF
MQTSRPRRIPQLGEVWLIDLGAPRQPGGPVGHEQGFPRPALVVSVDPFNHSGRGLHLVAPISSSGRATALHVPINPPEANLLRPSRVLVDQVRMISSQRLQRYIGAVGPPTLAAVRERLRFLQGL